MRKLLPGLALILAMSGCGGDDDDSGGSLTDATPSGSDAAPQADASVLVDAADSNYGVQIIRPSCAPNDEASVRILLGSLADGDPCAVDESLPSVDLQIWAREIEAPANFSFAPGEALGAGAFCPGGGQPCRAADTGEVQFDSFEDGAGAVGTWTLFEEDAGTSGEFTATWCEPDPPEPCG